MKGKVWGVSFKKFELILPYLGGATQSQTDEANG